MLFRYLTIRLHLIIYCFILYIFSIPFKITCCEFYLKTSAYGTRLQNQYSLNKMYSNIFRPNKSCITKYINNIEDATMLIQMQLRNKKNYTMHLSTKENFPTFKPQFFTLPEYKDFKKLMPQFKDLLSTEYLNKYSKYEIEKKIYWILESVPKRERKSLTAYFWFNQFAQKEIATQKGIYSKSRDKDLHISFIKSFFFA